MKKKKKLSLLTVWRWQWRLDDGGACESSHHSQPSVAPRLLSIMWARLKKGGKQTRFYCLIIHTRTKKDFWLINTIISQGSLNRACMKEENLSGEWSLFTWKPADSAVLTTEPRPAKGHKLMVRTRAATLSCDPGICGTLAPPRGHRQIWHLTLFNQREQLFIPNLGFGWCICGGFVLNCKNLCEFRTVGSSLWPAVCHTQLQVCKNKVTAYAQIMPKLWKPGRQSEPETSLPKLREDDTNQRKQATKNWTTRPPSSSGNKRTNWGRRQII